MKLPKMTAIQGLDNIENKGYPGALNHKSQTSLQMEETWGQWSLCMIKCVGLRAAIPIILAIKNSNYKSLVSLGKDALVCLSNCMPESPAVAPDFDMDKYHERVYDNDFS